MSRTAVTRITLVVALLAGVLFGCAKANPTESSSKVVPLRVRSNTIQEERPDSRRPKAEASFGRLVLDASLSRDSSGTLSVEATVTNTGPASISLDPGISLQLTPDGGQTLYSDLGFRLKPDLFHPMPSFGQLGRGDSVHRRFVTRALAGSSDGTVTVQGSPFYDGGPSIDVRWAQVPTISP